MRTNRDKRLSLAIRLALGTSLAATMVVGPVANAAEEEEEAARLERVQVTGSRISRLDVEGATPVVTVSREDLDNSGFQSVADFLRSNSFNSFGSFSERSGTTWQGQATLSLRGLGSDRTLILINGKRLPGSPVMDGQIQNLNTIPFAAVERIEILSDGASAIYGSDAIGGVVNVILRSDFEGGEVTARATDPDRPGGAERGISIVAGFGGDRGRVTFAIEADHQDTTLARDRFFTANQLLDPDNPNDVGSYSNYSFYGRNVIDFSGRTFEAYSMIQGDPDNPNDNGCSLYGEGFHPTNLHYSAWSQNAYTCNYDYTGVAATTAQLDRLAAFMSAEYEINSDLLFTAQILATRVESWGRYAPAAAPVTWSGASLEERDITVNGNPYTLNPIDTGDRIYFRWNNIGPARDTWQYDYQFDLQAGLQGFYDGIQWHANFQHDQYDLQEWGNGYIHNLGVAYVAENFGYDPVDNPTGWDPRHPNQAQYSDVLGNIAANSNRRGAMRMQRVDVGAQFDGPMLSGGPALFFVGGEYSDQEYFDETLAQMEVFNIGGTAGGSSGGSRSNWAVFSEASLPFGSDFELNPAVRYDSYNDFGTNVSYKLSGRYQPVDYWLLRASVGTGFRAPSLDELYQSSSQSFSFARDLEACTKNPTGAGSTLTECFNRGSQQYETYFNANPDLDAEESTQFLLGTVFDFNQFNGLNLTLSLDYYYTEIDNVITFLSSQDAFWLEYLGLIDQYPAVTVNRLPASEGNTVGNHDFSTVAPINFESFDTSGIDFRANYGQSLGAFGDLSLGFQLNYVLEYNNRDLLVGPLVDVTDRRGTPQYRANFDAAWTLGRHTVAWNMYFIPGQCEASTLNPNFDGGDFSTFYRVCSRDDNPDTAAYDGKEQRVGGYAHHNVSYIFEAPWNARVSVGVNNVTDKDPILDRNQSYSSSLYPIVSRAYVVSYTQRF